MRQEENVNFRPNFTFCEGAWRSKNVRGDHTVFPTGLWWLKLLLHSECFTFWPGPFLCGVCMGFLHILLFPLKVQRRALRLTGAFSITSRAVHDRLALSLCDLNQIKSNQTLIMWHFSQNKMQHKVLHSISQHYAQTHEHSDG